MRLSVWLLVGVLLATACTAHQTGLPDTAMPPAASPTQAAVASHSSTPAPPMATPERTEVFFCEAERGGAQGYLMSEQCPGNGFITTLVPDELAAFRHDPFLPSCLQSADGGMRVIIGAPCSDDRGSVITDPRPDEFKDVIDDGDVVPWCRNSGPPDWAITVGPPCIFEGQGGTVILSRAQSVSLEWRADCEAAWYFRQGLQGGFARLAVVLEPFAMGDASWEETRVRAGEVLTELEEARPGERARRWHQYDLVPAYEEIVARLRDTIEQPDQAAAADLVAEAEELAGRIEPPPHC